LRKADVALAVVLFAAAFALRIPFRSQYAYHWDSAEFTLAIRDYNVALSQPHVPGYFLYVMLGRLLNFFVGDPHASLVWLSVVAGSGLVALLYVLGVEMFDRRVGLAAALFGMTSPQLWFHSCVALMYTTDSLLACLIVLCCWRAQQRGYRWPDAVMIGGLLAVIGGIRQQTAPGLVPLVVWVLWQTESRRLVKLAAALGVCAVGTLAWLVPMVRMSGGWVVYAKVFHLSAVYWAPATLAGGGMNALSWNLFFTGLYCWNGLLACGILLAGALFVRLRMDANRKRRWDAAHSEALWMLALWIVPMMLMQTTLSLTNQAGHVLSYLPAWIVLAAVAASQLRKPAIFGTAVTTVCLINAAAFLALPPVWDRAFYGTGRTAQKIQEHDREMSHVIHTIRARLIPSETLVCHAYENLSLGLRNLQLYLPEFEQYQLRLDPVMLSPPDKPMISVSGGQLVFVHGPELTGKRVLALIVPPGTSLDDYTRYVDTRGAKLLPESGGTVYEVPVEAMR
jgi:hypothetical protein